MKLINKNILDIEEGIIVHQVNCQKVMGAGLARQIKDKYPIVFDLYRKTNWTLGKIQLVKINENLFVCNLAGQNTFGNSKYRYTDYDAIRKGLKELNKLIKKLNYEDFPIYIPHGMGAGLGNGNWNTIYNIIKEEIPTTIICKLKDK